MKNNLHKQFNYKLNSIGYLGIIILIIILSCANVKSQTLDSKYHITLTKKGNGYVQSDTVKTLTRFSFETKIVYIDNIKYIVNKIGYKNSIRYWECIEREKPYRNFTIYINYLYGVIGIQNEEDYKYICYYY